MNYPGYQAPLQGMANQMAQYGRYGDSMLVHMNPAEVQGIAALSPTGKLTTNPVTGQPEAFLPFLAPILGTALGKAFLPALASKIGIAGLGGNLAGAIGSGLATTAVTGDLKEGILSGITGYGLGQMIGGAAKATDPAISATEEALKTAGKDVATTGAELAKSQASLEALSKAAGSPMSGVNPVADIASAGKAAADAQSAFQAATGAEAALQSRLAGLEGNITGMDMLTAPFREPGAFLRSAARPEAIIPIAVGEGTRGQMRMQDRLREDARRLYGATEEEKARALYNFEEALAQREKDYGPIMGYAAGGITSINPQNYMQNLQGLQRLAGQPVMMQAGGTTGAGARQASIRGPQVQAPPEEYRPGFDPEFQYFTQRTSAPVGQPGGGQTGGGVPGGTGAPTGGQLSPELIDRYTNLATTQGNFHRQSDLSGRNIANRERYLSDFMSLRAQYPELMTLDNVLDIDPAYRSGGDFDYSSIGQNAFGSVTQSAPAGTAAPLAQTASAPRSSAQSMGMDFYNDVIELNPGISPAEVGRMTAQRYPGFVPPGGAAPSATGIAALGGPDAEAMGLSAQERMTTNTSAQTGQLRPGSMTTVPGSQFTDTPAADTGMLGTGTVGPGASLTPATTPSSLDTLLSQLQQGQYVYGDASQAFRSGNLTQDQLDQFTSALNQYTGTAPGQRPYSVGDVVTAPVGIAGLGASSPAAAASSPFSAGGRRGMTDGRMAQRFQEGGEVEIEIEMGGDEMDDTMEANGSRLIEQTAAAIAGNMPEDQAEAIINRFIDEYGPEAFEMLRERVLQDIVPGAQTEGRIEGQGGGMDDMIPGMIGTQQPVAVSPGEYIVPADVVSGLGDGDTDAGATELDGMLDRVRQARTGRRMQPQPLQKDKVMPA
jgi:hypothetical protein